MADPNPDSSIPGARNLRCPPGTVLYRPGEECPGFVIVHSGSIRVFLTGASGREVVLYRVCPGDICLQTFSCLANNRTYSAEAVTESDVVADVVPPALYRQLMEDNPTFRERILQAVSRRFGEFEQLIETLALDRIETRLAAALLRLADDQGVVMTTHDALAAEIGSAREVVSRHLARLARQGLVDATRGRIRLLDRAGLDRLSHPPA